MGTHFSFSLLAAVAGCFVLRARQRGTKEAFHQTAMIFHWLLAHVSVVGTVGTDISPTPT